MADISDLEALQKAIVAAHLDKWNPVRLSHPFPSNSSPELITLGWTGVKFSDFLSPRFRKVPTNKQAAQTLVQYLCPGAFSGDIFDQTFLAKFRDVLNAWGKSNYSNERNLTNLHGVNLDVLCADFFQGLAKHLTAVFALLGGPAQGVTFKHAFAVRFQQRAGHFSHTDDCDLTLNTCILNSKKGNSAGTASCLLVATENVPPGPTPVVKTLRETGLSLEGHKGKSSADEHYSRWVQGLMMRYQQPDFESQLKRIEAKKFYAIPFEENQTIVHSGYQEHGSLATGYSHDRMNLIMFFNFQYSFPLFTQFLDDIKLHILKFVSVPDVVHLQSTCKGMKKLIARNQGLWKHKFQDYAHLTKKIPFLFSNSGSDTVPDPYGLRRGPMRFNPPNQLIYPTQPYGPAPFNQPNIPPQFVYNQPIPPQSMLVHPPQPQPPQPIYPGPNFPLAAQPVQPVGFGSFVPKEPPPRTAWPVVDMQGKHDWPSVFKAAYVKLQGELKSDSVARGTIVQEIPMKAITYTAHFQTLHDATVFLPCEIPDYRPFNFCQIQ